MLNQTFINATLNLSIKEELQFSQLALSNSTFKNTLTFLDDKRYLSEVLENENITGLFIRDNLEVEAREKRQDIFYIVDNDPRFAYYTLFNKWAKLNKMQFHSIIDESSQIHETAFVSEFNVKIGKNTVIYPNVTILSDVEIGDNCVIQSGTVIGSEGFEFKRTKNGLISVYHDGKVTIGNNVEIGANTCVDKGFSFRNTIIKNHVKIDNLVHVAHGVQIDEGSFIIASAMLGGSVSIGKDVWVSPNSSIKPGITLRSKAFVSLASVVTKDVEEGTQVTGNFAIPHAKFIRNFKRGIE